MAQPLWLEQLKKASWRGVAFQVDASDITGGGDTILVRQYPFQELPRTFWLGSDNEEIKLTTYVIGEDYHLQRDALREALRNVPEEGGVLIHPTLGALRCQVLGRPMVKEAFISEGGVARFEIAFVRTSARSLPVAQANTALLAEDAADAFTQAAIDEFDLQWDTGGLPSWGNEAVKSRYEKLLDLINKQINIPGLRDVIDFGNTALAYYQLALDAQSLLSSPRALATRIATLFGVPTNWIIAVDTLKTSRYSAPSAADLPTQAQDTRAQAWLVALKPTVEIDASLPKPQVLSQSITPSTPGNSTLGGAGLTLFMVGVGQAVPLSPIQSQVDALTYQLDSLVRSLALAAAVRAAMQIDLRNIDQAYALRAQLNDWHTQALSLASEQPASRLLASGDAQRLSWYDTLAQMHAAALANLQERSAGLARLTTYTPSIVQPVWFISYRLYGTIKWADEILAMNPHIKHPLLVPAGIALRVIRHD